MTPLVDEFTDIFRAEHRQVRDRLLELISAFERRDPTKAAALLDTIAQLTGPHFRYEEEALYPALTDIFGLDYIEKLLADHDQAIANARRLVQLAQQDALTDTDAAEATALARAILPHVSDCDGLSIMVEVIPDESVRSVLIARDHARLDDLDLLAWSSTVRERRPQA